MNINRRTDLNNIKTAIEARMRVESGFRNPNEVVLWHSEKMVVYHRLLKLVENWYVGRLSKNTRQLSQISSFSGFKAAEFTLLSCSPRALRFRCFEIEYVFINVRQPRDIVR